jgi:hypothetical protein
MSQESSLTQSGHSVRQALTAYSVMKQDTQRQREPFRFTVETRIEGSSRCLKESHLLAQMCLQLC